MSLNPEMRASDTDRERVAAALREHMAQGRLTMDEMQERLDQTYASKTFGDLMRVTADLPEHDMYELPVPASRHSRSGPPVRQRGGGELYRKGVAAAWATWGSVTFVCTVIWILTMVGTGAFLYPWPIWVAGPWGAVLVAGTIFGPRQRGR